MEFDIRGFIRRRWWLMTMVLIVVVGPIVGIALFQKAEARRVIALAMEGDTGAQLRAGKFYAEGLGVEVDLVEAARWYLMAAESGHALAQQRIGDAYLYGLGVEQDSRTGFRWYMESANRGSSSAMLKVSDLYLEGIGVEPNIALSYQWAWLVYAAAMKPEQVHQGVALSDVTANTSLRQVANPIYDLLTEQDKEAAEERAKAWEPTPYTPLD